MTRQADREGLLMQQLLEEIDLAADSIGLELHAIVLVGTYGSMVADWAGSTEHAHAIADKIMTAAAKTRAQHHLELE